MDKRINWLTQLAWLLMFLPLSAQVEELRCGSESPDLKWEMVLQNLLKERLQNENLVGQTSGTFVIPVVFHVIHGGENDGVFPNISAGQIHSQLQIINEDFSGISYNANLYPSNAFVNWAAAQNIPPGNLDSLGRIKIANLDIQFCLATHDTNGNSLPEPGINRINYLSRGWQNPQSFPTQSTMISYLNTIVKPSSTWNATQYLNIWISDKSTSLNHAGVSSVPPLSGLMDLPNNTTLNTDGIWCYTKAIGSYSLFPGGSYISSFIDGRTLTHELGHYLGMRHIWGDTTCGNDFCADTPPAASENTLSPVYPHNIGSCTMPANNQDGEMFMNFMDYTRGPSKYMFTEDQKSRAITVMLNSPFRNQLGTQVNCTVTERNEGSPLNTNQVLIYPNPGRKELNIVTGGEAFVKAQIFNSVGLLLEETDQMQVSLESFKAGIYFVRVETKRNVYTYKFLREH